MKSYFQFVSDIAKQRGISFKEAILDKNTKQEWNKLRPKKTKKSKVVTSTVPILPQPELSTSVQQQQRRGLDLSRAKDVPIITNYVQPDVLNDQFNQRFLQFVNNIPYQNFREIFDITKRQSTLSLYDMSKLKPHLSDVTACLEDSQLSYELSGYICNSRTVFNGKRNLKLIRNDLTRYSRNLRDINIQGTINIFQFNILDALKKYPKMAQLSERLHDFLPRSFKNLTLVYLNDMLYNKVDFYKILFIYGMLLSKVQSNNKKLIIASSYNLGESIKEFYSRIDTGVYSSGDTDFGITASTTEFNFPLIVNYLSGQNITVESYQGDNFRSEFDNTSLYNPYQTPTKPETRGNVPLFSQAERKELNDIFFHSGPNNPQNPNTFIDDELNYRIYFKREKLLSMKNIDIVDIDVGDFIYWKQGQIGQVKRISPLVSNVNKVREIEVFSLTPARQLRDTSNTFGRIGISILKSQTTKDFFKITFISPETGRSNGFEYTNLGSLCFDPNITYKEMYEKLKQFIDTNHIDPTNNRYPISQFVRFSSSPNTLIEEIKDDDIQPQTEQQGIMKPVTEALGNVFSSAYRTFTPTKQKKSVKLNKEIAEIEKAIKDKNDMYDKAIEKYKLNLEENYEDNDAILRLREIQKNDEAIKEGKEKIERLKKELEDAVKEEKGDKGAGMCSGGSSPRDEGVGDEYMTGGSLLGNLYDVDLLAWRSAFSLKGIDNKGSFGNGQNLYVLYF